MRYKYSVEWLRDCKMCCYAVGVTLSKGYNYCCKPVSNGSLFCNEHCAGAKLVSMRYRPQAPGSEKQA
jgi:hypothetical protein